MKKLERYEQGFRLFLADGVYNCMGCFCTEEDVARLEASHAELLEAATNALGWWDGGNKISPKASDVIGRLRAAIAKANGGGAMKKRPIVVQRPEPYVKPKRWRAEYRQGSGCWVITDNRPNLSAIGTLLTENNDEHREAAEEIAAIYERTMP